MEEIKVKIDVMLNDSKYYLNQLCDKIDNILDNLDFVNRRKESLDRVYELYTAKRYLHNVTEDTEEYITLFKNNKIKDIEKAIMVYAWECNDIIRVIINKEGV